MVGRTLLWASLITSLLAEAFDVSSHRRLQTKNIGGRNYALQRRDHVRLSAGDEGARKLSKKQGFSVVVGLLSSFFILNVAETALVSCNWN